MVRKALVLVFSTLLINPVFSQSIKADWQFLMELQQDSQGDIEVTYSKSAISNDLYELSGPEPGVSEMQRAENSFNMQVYGPVNSQTLDMAPWMNNDGRINLLNVVMSAENRSGNNYQMILSYFMFLNPNILPELNALMNPTLPLPTNALLISPRW